MRSLTNDFSILQYKDLVGMKDRIDTLCNDNHRRILCLLCKCFSKCRIRLVIKRGKAVVKDQYLGLLCDSSCNRKSLLLSTGNIRSAL